MRYAIRGVGFLVSALSLWVLARLLHPSALMAALRDAQPLWLIPAVFFLALFLVLNAHRWRSLLSPVCQIPSVRLLRWQLIGYLANTVLPLRAGDLCRALLVGKGSAATAAAGLATIVVEKICDGATVVGFLVLGILLLDVPPWVDWIARVSAIVFSGGVIVLLILSSHPPLSGRVAHGPIGRLYALLAPALAVIPGPRALALVLGRSILMWSASILNTLCILHAVGIDASLAGAILINAGLGLATTIPAGPAAIGSYELAIVALVGVVGVTGAPAQLAALAMRAAQYAPPALAGVVALAIEGTNLRDLRGQMYDDSA